MRISRTRYGSARILAVVAVCACAALAAAALTTAARAGAAHLAGQPASSSTAAGYQLPAVLDVSDLSWRRAFDGLHEKMVREYAFTAWKGIDWGRCTPSTRRASRERRRPATRTRTTSPCASTRTSSATAT